MLAALAAALSLLLAGVMAGFFYAYSVSAMPGLDRIDGDQAIAAMRGINEAVRNPVFFLSFFGTPVVALITAGLLFLLGEKPAALLLALAGIVYLLGAFLPTAIVNVPMNEALARADLPLSADEVARVWTTYSVRWTGWNTLRTVFSTISLLLVGLGIFVWGRS